MAEKYIEICDKIVLVKDENIVVDIRKLIMGKKTQVVLTFDTEGK